ncbi:MAG: sensor histidine kinase [Crocinitomicaceae bacterium]|nr:sensor histidine kinase [Crocinitomicaceae bacterium]
MKKYFLRYFMMILILTVFVGREPLAQINKAEQHILNQQYDSAKYELSKIPSSSYTKSLLRISQNQKSEQDILKFVVNAQLNGEIQHKKLNNFIQQEVQRPTDKSKINLNYVLIKWQQINNLRNELSVAEATSENIKLKKYINEFNAKDKNVQKANVYHSIHEIVLYLIQGDVAKSKKLCQNGLENAVQLKDTNLILTAKYYLSNVLMAENRLDEYILNCKESLAIEDKLSVESPYYESTIHNLVDALIYKNDFDPTEIFNLLKLLRSKPNHRIYSYSLFVKLAGAIEKDSPTFASILSLFEVNDLLSFCEKVYAEAAGQINSNELYHLSSECSKALLIHKYYEEAFVYKNKCIELTRKTYSKELSQSIADLKTQEIENEKEIQIEKAEQKSTYFIIIIMLISVFLIVSISLLYRLRMKTKKLNKRSREKEILLVEVHHRVKNNFQLIIAFIRLQQRYSDQSSISEFINQLELKMNSMSMVHEMLYKDLNIDKIELLSYLEEMGNYIIEAIENNNTEIVYKVSGSAIQLSLDQAIPLGLVVNEIITNSIKHVVSDTLAISLQISDYDQYFEVIISDDGPGIQKEINLKETNSFGMKVITLLMNQMNASVEWNSLQGTECRLTIPKKK